MKWSRERWRWGVLRAPGVLPHQIPGQLPPAQQARIEVWRATPPQQRPRGLPAVVTTLTPDLLVNTGEVALCRQLITEVGVGNINRGTGVLMLLPFTPNFTSHLVFTGLQAEGQ